MKRKSEEDVFEDADAIEPFMWRLSLLELWAKNIVDFIKSNWKNKKQKEIDFGEHKGLNQIQYGVWLQCSMDIPPNVKEPSFDGVRCYVSETRWKQLEHFADHFEDNLGKKIDQTLTKEIDEIVKLSIDKGFWHRRGNFGFTLSIYLNKKE